MGRSPTTDARRARGDSGSPSATSLAAQSVEGAGNVPMKESRVITGRGFADVEAGQSHFGGLSGDGRLGAPGQELIGESVGIVALLDQAAGVQLGVLVDESLVHLVGLGVGGYVLDEAEDDGPNAGQGIGKRGSDRLVLHPCTTRCLGGLGPGVSEEDLLLVSEIAEESRAANFGTLGYVRDTHLVEAALAEELKGGSPDGLFGPAPLAIPQRPGRGRFDDHERPS